jgi:Protein of unknown function (DUF1559)
MPVAMTCACGKQFRVPDELVGRRVKCPGCGDPVNVPAPAKAAAKPAVPTKAAVPARKPAPADDDSLAERGKPALIRFECECGKSLQAKAEHAGKKIRCPGCQELVTVPAEEEEEPEEGNKKSRISTERSSKSSRPLGKSVGKHDDDELDELDELDEEDEDRPRKKGKDKGKGKGKSSLWMWVGIAAGILVLVGAGIGAWLLLGGGGSSADMSLVPANGQGFVTVRVADLWKTSLVQDALKKMPKAESDKLAEAEKEFGLSASELDRITAVFQDVESEKVWVIFYATKAVDRAKITKKLEVDSTEKTHQGKSYQVSKVSGKQGAIHFINDKTFVVAPEAGMKACLDQAAKPVTEGNLASAIKGANTKHHFAAGFALPANLMQKAKQGIGGNPQLASLGSILDLKSGTLSLNLSGQEVQMEVGMAFPDEKKASTAKKALDDVKKMAEGLLPMLKMGGDPAQVKVADQAEKALKSLTISQSGSDVRIAMKGEIPSNAVNDLPIQDLFRLAGPGKGVDNIQGQNNLKQLALAFHNQASSLGGKCFFTPDIGKDQTGKPLLSWRVAILPYIEQDNLYRQFRLNEPWNSPNNIRLLNMMPKTFEVPGRPAAAPGETFYQVFTGPQTLFEKTWSPNLPGSFTRGLTNTVMIVEGASSVPWTKPDDIVLGPNPMAQLGFSRDGKSTMALADGSVRTITRAMRSQTLRNAIMAQGDPNPGPDW